MVIEGNGHEGGGFDQVLGEGEVGTRGGGVAGRVVVGDDVGGSGVSDCRTENLAGVDEHLRQGPYGDGFGADQPPLGITQKDGQVLCSGILQMMEVGTRIARTRNFWSAGLLQACGEGNCCLNLERFGTTEALHLREFMESCGAQSIEAGKVDKQVLGQLEHRRVAGATTQNDSEKLNSRENSGAVLDEALARPISYR